MPDRGLVAPLSPNEEVTLRRVAIGIAKSAELPLAEVERLKALLLVEETDGSLRLTPVGRERYLALPNSAGICDFDVHDEMISKMAKFIIKSRR